MNLPSLLLFAGLLVAQGSNAANLTIAGQVGTADSENPGKADVTAQRLVTAHAEALRHYRNNAVLEFMRVHNAIEALKAAGITQTLKAKPPSISESKLAEILNDYGFFLSKASRHKEAIDAYNRVIQLDPTRAVTHLNLGDSLRARLSDAPNFDEKIRLTKQIKSAYLRFRQFGGRTTKAVDAFLTLNVVDNPIPDFCQYVAAYTNQGRLREIFGTGEEVIREDGTKKMRVSVRYEGSGHFATLSAVDAVTGEEIGIGEIPEIKDSDSTQNIDIVPYMNGHHMLVRTDERYLDRSAPIGYARRSGKECQFRTKVAISLNSVVGHQKLCSLARTGDIQYLDNEIEHSLSPEFLKQEFDNRRFNPKTYMIDFDNDGRGDVLLKSTFLYPGGRSCQLTQYDLLTSKRDGFDQSNRRLLLRGMQKVPSLLCEGQVNWFRYSGVTYLEIKYPGKSPNSSREEIHRVLYVNNGRIKVACEVVFNAQTVVDQRPDETNNWNR